MSIQRKKIPWSSWAERAFRAWLRHYKPLFFLSFLTVAAVGGWEWRQSLFTASWTPEQRQAYLDQTIKETVFHEDEFLSVLKKVEVRRLTHAAEAVPSESLFVSGKKAEEKR